MDTCPLWLWQSNHDIFMGVGRGCSRSCLYPLPIFSRRSGLSSPYTFYLRLDHSGFHASRPSAARARYSLILLDLEMPEMGGLEASRRIRALPAHRDTPIIALTAASSSEVEGSCLASGMTSILTKPLSGRDWQTILAIATGRGTA